MYGLAVDERSSLVVDKRGVATLLKYSGAGYQTRGAYLVHLVEVKQLVPRRPFVATVAVLHLAHAGARVNLLTKRGEGNSYRVTVDGAKSPPYSRDPY
jgi:hypothetical protein